MEFYVYFLSTSFVTMLLNENELMFYNCAFKKFIRCKLKFQL